ncbi:hypothetical protein BIY23_00470 [Wolbachia pipientis]|uniref:Uncharacterized protein n=1 Tax=Wolbachia pipientis TaxID=955 RepID=A0A1E7QL72_WOLPI|nr:hypothetical protein [Wolbachia pipientis]OEY86964.1 hypothetical protein BIY23_00470 [Wolbachia pipientis]
MHIISILLLVFFPFLTFSVENKGHVENSTVNTVDCKFDYSYYPGMDYNSAYELYTIKHNYHRYSNELKILANKRIKKILNKNKS